MIALEPNGKETDRKEKRLETCASVSERVRVCRRAVLIVYEWLCLVMKFCYIPNIRNLLFGEETFGGTTNNAENVIKRRIGIPDSWTLRTEQSALPFIYACVCVCNMCAWISLGLSLCVCVFVCRCAPACV